MTEIQLAELIDSYLDGYLNEKDRAVLEAKVNSDPAIAAELALRKEIANAVSEEDVLLLEFKLLEAGKKAKANLDSTRQEAKVVPMFRKYRALAAGVAIFIIAALVFLLRIQEPVDLYSAYFEPYPMYLNTRSGTSPGENLNMAIQAYEQKNYQTAWSSFLAIVAKDPSNMGAMFYTALSALQLENIPDAVAGFKKVANHGDSIYAAPAEWYLALAFIKSGDNRNAKKTMEAIIEKETDFAEKAKSALEVLKK